MFNDICVDGKPCELMKAVNNPKYGSCTILTDSCWEYVSLFFKRQSTEDAHDALFYWEQAHSFYLASKELPDNAQPLTSYYCILNATKALLRYKGIDHSKLQKHGISSVRDDTSTNLEKAHTSIKGAGVLPQLSQYYEPNILTGKYTIAELLYNIPCIHRAYCITFSKPEIFTPIKNPTFVQNDNSKDTWIKFELSGRYANPEELKDLPTIFERDNGVQDKYVMRMKKRFNWDTDKPLAERQVKLNNYHKKTREHLFYIFGATQLWYIKKDTTENARLSRTPSTVLIFAVFHWLSELVRYTPKLFSEYMKSEQNWLLHEFINSALDQFIDEISCEITGNDIMCTGYRK